MTSSAAHSRACCRPPAASPRRPGTARHRRGLPAGVPGTCRHDWQLRHPAPAATPRTSTPATSMPAMTPRIASSPRRRQIFPATSPNKTCPNGARKSPAARTTGNGRYASVSVPPVSGRDGRGRIWRVTPPGTRSRARAVRMARSASLPSWPESNRPRYRTAPCANRVELVVHVVRANRPAASGLSRSRHCCSAGVYPPRCAYLVLLSYASAHPRSRPELYESILVIASAAPPAPGPLTGYTVTT